MNAMIHVGISEAADYLNQTTKQLQRWDNDNVLPAHKTSGGHRYYYHHELNTMKNLLSGITRKDASILLGVSEKTLWRWNKNGILPYRYMIGHTGYYLQSDIDHYLKIRYEEGEQHETAIV